MSTTITVHRCETVEAWLRNLTLELGSGGVPYCRDDKGAQMLCFQVDQHQYQAFQLDVDHYLELVLRGKGPDRPQGDEGEPLGMAPEALQDFLTRRDQRRAWFDKWSEDRQVDTFQEFLEIVVARRRRGHTLSSTDDPQRRTLGFTDVGYGEGLLPGTGYWAHQTICIPITRWKATKRDVSIPGIDVDAVIEQVKKPIGRAQLLMMDPPSLEGSP